MKKIIILILASLFLLKTCGDSLDKQARQDAEYNSCISDGLTAGECVAVYND